MPEKDPLSAQAWRGRVEASRSVKKDLLRTWQDNVAYRKGKPFRVGSQTTDETVNVPEDWSRTKNKQSQLFYQIPEVKLKARRPEYIGATSVFAAALNFELTQRVHPEHMMNECLGDVINASGIAICEVGYEASFEDVALGGDAVQPSGFGGAEASVGSEYTLPSGSTAPPLSPMPGAPPGQQVTSEQPPQGIGAPPVPPTPPPSLATPMGPGGIPQQQTVARPIYECFYANRISPAHFLWPIEFIESDWQKASWLGREGYMPLAEAQRRKWVGADAKGVSINDSEWLLSMDDNVIRNKSTDQFVKYVVIYYRPHDFDAEEKDPRKIKQVILIDEGGEHGTKKVFDEDFKWQKYDPATRKWIGMTQFPIKVMTITYISDQAIPPSDSEIGRPQVKELIRARTDMQMQRRHSIPLRWYDVNMVDPMIGDRLRKGKWLDMIPMNGPGEHAIGEVARAQYPQQNFEFNKIAQTDLDKGWSMGDSQQSIATPGDTTAEEVRAMNQSLNVRLDFERSWVLRFFMQVAEGVAQLMQLFCDDEDYVWVVGEQGKQEMMAWNKQVISGEYVFEAKPDSQLRLDVTQERNQSLNLYKLLRKDPLINPTGLVQQLLEVHGLDPAKGMAPQEPPKPEPPKVSYSFKGEDLMNPLVVAVMQKGPTPITVQDIQAAQQLLQSATALPMPQQPMPEGQPAEGAPTGANPEHPGVPEQVEELDRRFVKSGTSVEGSRDSSLPAR